MRNALIHIIFLLMLVPLTGAGQEDTGTSSRISLGYPVYSQYLQNGLMINPAYAGSREALSMMVSHRSQWIGMASAPLLQSLSAHSPMKNDKVALGLKAQFMTYGATKESSIYAVYAYHIRVNRGKLSLGIGGGVDISNTDYSILQGITLPDPVFTPNDKAYTMPNVTAGAYYFDKRFFAGLSVPAFMSYLNTGNGNIEMTHSLEAYSFIATTGGLITFSDDFKFKPSALVQYSVSEGVEKLDINGNFIISDLIWVGGSWRCTEDVVVGLVQANLNQQLMVGFSYDYPLGKMNSVTKGSIEIVLRYELGSKVSAADPRYF